MRICVIGSGYVGLVTAACLSESGNHVVAVDQDEIKVKALRDGRCPFFEPGLQELVGQNMRTGPPTLHLRPHGGSVACRGDIPGRRNAAPGKTVRRTCPRSRPRPPRWPRS